MCENRRLSIDSTPSRTDAEAEADADADADADAEADADADADAEADAEAEAEAEAEAAPFLGATAAEPVEVDCSAIIPPTPLAIDSDPQDQPASLDLVTPLPTASALTTPAGSIPAPAPTVTRPFPAHDISSIY